MYMSCELNVRTLHLSVWIIVVCILLIEGDPHTDTLHTHTMRISSRINQTHSCTCSGVCGMPTYYVLKRTLRQLWIIFARDTSAKRFICSDDRTSASAPLLFAHHIWSYVCMCVCRCHAAPYRVHTIITQTTHPHTCSHVPKMHTILWTQTPGATIDSDVYI